MSFRRRPSHHKQPRAQASWLVPGYSASDILHGARTTHLITAKSSDHRKRYAPGQRLAVKDYVPGPTVCHVRLNTVRGPAGETPFTLGDVDFTIARALGHVRLDDFRIDWVRHNDQAWWERADQEAAAASVEPDELRGANEILDERALERFNRRWAPKLAWLLTFTVDTVAQPRMLAAAPSIYDPQKENAEGRDEDRGYTTADARALNGEHPALTDTEWAAHVGPESPYRRAERIAAQKQAREAKGWQERLAWAKSTAKAKGADIRDECRRFDRLMEQGKTEKAMRQLELIEQRVFPAAA